MQERIDISIPTLAGVEAHTDPAGRIDVIRGENDNIVTLVVREGSDMQRPRTVYLDRRMVAELMMALGVAAHHM